jgi:predicted enzyme related to lactoylglutathione lyase
MRSSVVHLELHTDDRDGAVGFLSRLVGWETEEVRAGAGSYLALDVGDRVQGGVVECGLRPAQWLPYVAVADVAGCTRAAEQMGARVLVGPRGTEAGWRSVIDAPASGVLGLWQPSR